MLRFLILSAGLLTRSIRWIITGLMALGGVIISHLFLRLYGLGSSMSSLDTKPALVSTETPITIKLVTRTNRNGVPRYDAIGVDDDGRSEKNWKKMRTLLRRARLEHYDLL